jgi:hypothetical protein
MLLDGQLPMLAAVSVWNLNLIMLIKKALLVPYQERF